MSKKLFVGAGEYVKYKEPGRVQGLLEGGVRFVPKTTCRNL
jgi:hypothetical protein